MYEKKMITTLSHKSVVVGVQKKMSHEIKHKQPMDATS